MANTKSAVKRHRQSERRRQRNRFQISTMRTAIKNLRNAISEGDKDQIAQLLPGTLKIVDSTAGKGMIHANKAARTKSRLVKAAAAVSA